MNTMLVHTPESHESESVKSARVVVGIMTGSADLPARESL
jgi:hypothetical protein